MFALILFHIAWNKPQEKSEDLVLIFRYAREGGHSGTKSMPALRVILIVPSPTLVTVQYVLSCVPTVSTDTADHPPAPGMIYSHPLTRLWDVGRKLEASWRDPHNDGENIPNLTPTTLKVKVTELCSNCSDCCATE